MNSRRASAYMNVHKMSFAYAMLTTLIFGLLMGWWTTSEVMLTDMEKDGLMRQDKEHDSAIKIINEEIIDINYLLGRAYVNLPELREDIEWETKYGSKSGSLNQP